MVHSDIPSAIINTYHPCYSDEYSLECHQQGMWAIHITMYGHYTSDFNSEVKGVLYMVHLSTSDTKNY